MALLARAAVSAPRQSMLLPPISRCGPLAATAPRLRLSTLTRPLVLPRHLPSPSLRRSFASSSPRFQANQQGPNGSGPKSAPNGGSSSRLKLYLGLGGAAALTTVAVLSQTMKPSPSSTSASDADDHDYGFAQSIEEDESKPHPNAIVRFFISLGNGIQAYIIEPLGTTKRFIFLVILFLPVLITAPMIFVGRRREGGRRRGRRTSKAEGGQRWGAMWWYRFLVKEMERAGPTFIKLAQWAGSRQDLFPKELCDLFGKLHANGKPHSLKYTKKVIEKVFGRPFDEIFEDFPDDPIGIGAVGQVYRATLKPDLLPPQYLAEKRDRKKRSQISHQLALTYDEDHAPVEVPTASVAIKVLHPRVHRTINRDIKIMTFFAKIINFLPGAEWLSFPEEVDVFASMMREQLDLRNEANNLRRFEENFRKRQAAVSFPRPLFGFSTKEILIEEFEEAVPLKHFLNLGGAGFDHRIANLGLDAFLNMLLIDNFTHADLHPGNIMIKFYRPTTRSILKDVFSRILSRFDSDYAKGGSKAAPTPDDQAERSVVQRLVPLKHDQDAFLDELDKLDAEGYQPELVLIDAGLTVELTPENRRNFLDLFSAVAEFDGILAGHLMVERCRTPELVVDEETFALKMQDLVLGVKSKSFSLAKIKIGDVLTQVLGSVRTHHVKMEPDFTNTVISILLLEGIGRQLDPTMDLFKSALPILRNLGKELARTPDGLAGGLRGHNLKELTPMLKIWLWMEARSWVGSLMDVKTTDAFVKYDWLSTSI